MTDQPTAAGRVRSRWPAVLAVLVGGLLLGWFWFAWLVLHANVVDAAGESIGTGLAVLTVVAVVGAFRNPAD